MTIGRNLSKKGNFQKKKMGVSDLLKPQNPGKVVVLAESGIFAYKSSSAYMLSEGCGTIVT